MSLITFNKAQFERNKLTIQESITKDEWVELGQSLRQVDNSVQLWIGDWARFGDKQGFAGKNTDSKVYDELESVTGLERKTIQNYKVISEKTAAIRESYPRGEELTFTHFREVAFLPEDQQVEFLDMASEGKLSSRELRKEIKKIIPKLEKKAEPEETAQVIEMPTDLDVRIGELLFEINQMPWKYRAKIKQNIK